MTLAVRAVPGRGLGRRRATGSVVPRATSGGHPRTRHAEDPRATRSTRVRIASRAKVEHDGSKRHPDPRPAPHRRYRSIAAMHRRAAPPPPRPVSPPPSRPGAIATTPILIGPSPAFRFQSDSTGISSALVLPAPTIEIHGSIAAITSRAPPPSAIGLKGRGRELPPPPPPPFPPRR